MINEIIINTDAEEILAKDNLCNHPKVTIRERPAQLRGDQVSMNKIIEYDLLHSNGDIYLMTHTTNPLISGETISNAITNFEENVLNGKFDSLFTVNKIQTRFYSKKGQAINHNPKNLIPTQDLDAWYEENSNLYIFNKNSFNKTKARIGRKPILYETPHRESFDIDTPDDWEIAEAIALYKKNKLKG